jgi:DNA polymerase-1
MDDIVAQAKRDGFVTTLMGRKRNLPDINSPNKTRREFAERTALNTPIQGTAADIIKLASIDVEKHLQEKKLGARLLLQIHDELIFETPQHESEQTCQVVKVSMEKCFRLQVPLVVNLATGFNLAKV